MISNEILRDWQHIVETGNILTADETKVLLSAYRGLKAENEELKWPREPDLTEADLETMAAIADEDASDPEADIRTVTNACHMTALIEDVRALYRERERLINLSVALESELAAEKERTQPKAFRDGGGSWHDVTLWCTGCQEPYDHWDELEDVPSPPKDA